MHVIYINLDRQSDRRAYVEDQVGRFLPKDWECERLAAVNKADVDPKVYGTALPTGAIGLSLSHRSAVRRSLETDDHLLLLEDDVQFGPRSHPAIEVALKLLSPDSWDLLFTDACIPGAGQMIELFCLGKAKPGVITLLDLRKIVFAGSTSIIVNRKHKSKYLALLTDEVLFSMPIDLLIAKFVREGRLNAFLTFPFATSLSRFAESSQIQSKDLEIENVLWNAYRRLVWIDADMKAVDASLAKIPGSLMGDDARCLGRILGGLIACEVKKQPEGKATPSPA